MPAGDSPTLRAPTPVWPTPRGWVRARIALGLLGFLLAIGGSAHASGPWLTDFAAAMATAEREQKPLLLHFSAEWCLPCRKMEASVLSNPEVLGAISERFVAAKLDFDHNQSVARQFSVSSLPSDVVVDAANGHVLAFVSGPQDRRGYLSMLAKTSSRYGDLQRSRLVKGDPLDSSTVEATPLHPDAPQGTSKGLARADEPDSSTLPGPNLDLGEPQPLVGLDGFSPVALGMSRRWARGSREHVWEYHGIEYQFASRDELLDFRSDPELYAPRLLGCDPVLLFETDRAVAGSTRYAAYYDGELYLFTTQESRQRFRQRPTRYVRLQHVLKIEDIEFGGVRLGQKPDADSAATE